MNITHLQMLNLFPQTPKEQKVQELKPDSKNNKDDNSQNSALLKHLFPPREDQSSAMKSLSI